MNADGPPASSSAAPASASSSIAPSSTSFPSAERSAFASEAEWGAPDPSRPVASVVVASPLPQLDHVFEYGVPERMRESIAPGVRVTVPMRSGNRVLQGFVIGLREEASFQGRLAEIESVVSPVPVVSREVALLVREIADRQAGTAGDVLRLAVPPRSVRVEEHWWGEREERAGEPRPSHDVFAPEERLIRLYGEEAARHLVGPEPVRVSIDAPVGVGEGGAPRSLGMLADIAAAHVARGRSVLFAVPDFRDVALAETALTTVLHADDVVRLDARSKPAARYADFLRCLEERPRVILGTRSVLYAPAHELGAIIVWDDADESYEEPLAPYAGTRDVALVRHAIGGASLVFAAHAPSLAAERLVRMGWMRGVPLARRPRLRIIPTDAALDDHPLASRARIPSIAWREATAALERGPVLIQVARAGYSPALVCERCGDPARCTRCAGPLRVRSRGSAPVCGVCGHVHGDWRCAECGATAFRPVGAGAERTAEELGRAFPGRRVVVADGEAERVAIDDRPAIVVATRGAEPVPARGYAAVLLLDGERLLARESLDAAVETLRFWSNAVALLADGGTAVLVGGAAGPGRALATWQQRDAAERELVDRRALSFPPAVRVAQITGTAAEVAGALEAVRAAGIEGVEVLGPVPSPEGVGVRAVLRLRYASGRPLAAALKAELVRAATSKRPRVAGRPGGPASTLRVRFDPPRVFEAG